MASLEGQTILIVGGSSGIGYGVAKLSLLSKASTVIIASSNKSRVDNALSRLVFDADIARHVSDAKEESEERLLMQKCWRTYGTL